MSTATTAPEMNVRTAIETIAAEQAGNARAQTPALLKGLLFGPDGAAMSPTHTRKSGRLYRYYISKTAMKQGRSGCPVKLVPAAELERIIIDQVRLLLQTPEIIVRPGARCASNLLRSARRRSGPRCSALTSSGTSYFRQNRRIVELLVERIDMQAERMDITLKIQGLTSLSSELQPQSFQQAAE